MKKIIQQNIILTFRYWFYSFLSVAARVGVLARATAPPPARTFTTSRTSTRPLIWARAASQRSTPGASRMSRPPTSMWLRLSTTEGEEEVKKEEAASVAEKEDTAPPPVESIQAGAPSGRKRLTDWLMATFCKKQSFLLRYRQFSLAFYKILKIFWLESGLSEWTISWPSLVTLRIFWFFNRVLLWKLFFSRISYLIWVLVARIGKL